MTMISHHGSSGKAGRSVTMAGAGALVTVAALVTIGAMLLSVFGGLNRAGSVVLLVAGLVAGAWSFRWLAGGCFRAKGIRWHRFRRPFPLLYLACVAAAWIGGAVHAPTNHDAFSYRIPRILHWLAEGSWHWIGGADPRMDFSGTGYEALMLPTLGALHTLRLAFVPNAIGYLLLPGLIFTVFRGLGVRGRVAAVWMWVLSCATCFAVQAGSIGNDFLAAVLVLTSIAFALRCLKTSSHADLWLSVFAVALMTSVKASNLPLMLPVAVCLLAVVVRHPRRIASAVAAVVLALPVSFVPVAIANHVHAGDWTGEKGSGGFKLESPVAGLAGNAILIGCSAVVPPVFPPAEKLNAAFAVETDGALRRIRADFPDLRMTVPQLASEENSGLGLGVTAALVLGCLGSLGRMRFRRLMGLGGAVALGFGVALAFYMIKLGNCGAARLVMPYYAGVFLLPLLAIDSGAVFRQRWWRWSSLLLLLPVLPALALNPARPLLPMRAISTALWERNPGSSTLERLKVVYDVYAQRADPYAGVRRLLPADVSRIAFAGTSAETEYSFWLPLGTRRVTDFMPDRTGALPAADGFDAIVASQWGTIDRFGIPPQELARRLGWDLSKPVRVRALAAAGEVDWFVLTPPGS